MPLSVIWIEQKEARHWAAEVEIGGISSRRELVTASDFDGIMTAVAEVHTKFTATASKPSVLPAAPPEPVDDRAALLEQALSLGLDVDRRLGVERLREAIAAHEAPGVKFRP